MTQAKERQVCTNLWAYLHWLRATGQARLDGRDELRRWREAEPERWATSMRAFARLPDAPSALLHPPVRTGRLVLRSRNPMRRQVWSTAALARDEALALPADLERLLATVHPAEALTEAASVLLLEADLRPDDRLLVADATLWPWIWALREGATLILCPEADAGGLQTIAEEEEASLLVASGVALRISGGAPPRRAGDPADR